MQYKIKGFPSYVYDDIVCKVISFKRGYAYPLVWTGAQKQVTLYNPNQAPYKRICTALEVMTMLETPAFTTQVKGNEMGKFIIGSKSQNGFSFAQAPVIHNTEAEAKAEAERLARNNAGKTFVVMKVVGEVVANSVVWK